jgi:predicted site-specific integrase-resolvase
MAITLTLRDAAKESGLSIRTLYTLIGQGKLKSTTIGRRRLEIAKSLEELLLGKPQGQTREVHHAR